MQFSALDFTFTIWPIHNCAASPLCPSLWPSESVSCSVASGLFTAPWTVAHQTSLSMEFSSQEYWSSLPFPSPGVLSNPGIKSRSSALLADSLQSEPPWKPKPAKPWNYFSSLPQWHVEHLTWGAHLLVSYLFAFLYFMGFSRQEYWSDLPFLSLVGHVNSISFII